MASTNSSTDRDNLLQEKGPQLMWNCNIKEEGEEKERKFRGIGSELLAQCYTWERSLIWYLHTNFIFWSDVGRIAEAL
jgi:hypothetical protein